MKATLRQALTTPGFAGAVLVGRVREKLMKQAGISKRMAAEAITAMAALLTGIVLVIQTGSLAIKVAPNLDASLTANAVAGVLLAVVLVLSGALVVLGFYLAATSKSTRDYELLQAEKMDEEVEL